MVETLSEKQTYHWIVHNLFPLWIFSVSIKLISGKKITVALYLLFNLLKYKLLQKTKYQINTKDINNW